ncbi:MAG TPA: hypothetical protein DDW87_00140, partial [Firmicutes bacterium]|nr:hypothetical protein [Bacillota bacterium]
MEGKECVMQSAMDAMKAGICLVPENRKDQGLVLKMSVQHNVSLATLPKFKSHLGFVDRGKETASVKDVVSQLQIKTPSIEQLVG